MFCSVSGGMYSAPPMMNRYGMGLPLGHSAMVCTKLGPYWITIGVSAPWYLRLNSKLMWYRGQDLGFFRKIDFQIKVQVYVIFKI